MTLPIVKVETPDGELKATANSRVKTLMDVESEFRDRIIPKGTFGIIIECYENPEGYAIDLAISDPSLVGGSDYENVVLEPDQFEIVHQ